jgi:hypothetical protein
VLAAAAGRPDEAARHFELAVALAARWGAPAWELAAIADWARSPAPGAPVGRGLVLARDLELPWVAAELGRGQTTTP